MKKHPRLLVALVTAATVWFSGQAQARPVPEVFSSAASLPPFNGAYVSPAMWHAAYAQGIIIRDVSHQRFTQNLPVPPLGGTQVHTFGSTLKFEISQDGGATFLPASAPANVSVRVTHVSDVGGTSYFDTEMLALDLNSAAFQLRESPTLPSRGKTTMRVVPGGYMISSFFDIFTEVSLDGGVTWLPTRQAGHVELRSDPGTVPPITVPTTLLPPPNGVYVSPQQWHAAYAMGIVIKDVSHKQFTHSMPAPTTPGATATHSFDSQLDLKVSTDGGTTFQSVRTPAMVQVEVTRVSTGANALFDTEMTRLDFSIPAGGLPAGIMVRESPTRASRGQVQMAAQADGTYRISSFFDIFTEVSLDGGATWSPSTTGPARVVLEDAAPEQAAPTPNLPPIPGEYVSPEQWHALYAQGIIISNVSHSRFTQNQPPPPPGGTQVHSFNSFVDMDVILPGTPPVQTHLSAPAAVVVRVTSLGDAGGTRFFDTEMLSLNIQGGNLPAGMLVRESPSKASTGRTSVRLAPDGQYRISSFFDIFTELSLDGGATWSPMVSGPGTVGLRTPVTTPVAIACPTPITVNAAGPGGAVVSFTVTASGGCPGPVTVTCTPPSGSLFPVGTTTVVCKALDACGNVARCTFQVVVQAPATQVPEHFFPQPVLPPPTGVYISPAQWHLLYANGIVIRDVRHRRFTQSFAAPPLGATTVHSFGSTVDFEVSTTGLAGPFQPASGSANVTVRVTHMLDAGGKSFFDTEMLALDLTSGSFMLRESPTLPSRGQMTARVVPGGYMISSFFDIFTELSTDGGQTWMPAQSAGHVELRNDPALVEAVSTPTRLLPPPNQLYTSVQYPYAVMQNVVVRNINNKLFNTSQLPPTADAVQTQTFSSVVDMELSTDGGVSFQAVRAPAADQVRITNLGASDAGPFDAEVLQLNVSGGGLPTGMRLRESPTEPSRGLTLVALQSDGTYRINSFFDIFVELSLDNGATWTPFSTGPVRMVLQPQAPEQPEPTPSLPPLDGEYISPERWHALFASGIIITNVSHNRFTQNQPPPPPGGSQTEGFGSQVTGLISINGGASFTPFSAPANVAVQVISRLDAGNTRFFDTEMLSLSLSGGSLPGGLMVRESPSKASLGRVSIRQVGTQYRISSFFDIFTELSLDGGQTWSPSISGPGTVGLHKPIDPPVTIFCPPAMVVSATSTAGAVVNFVPLATGGCDLVPTMTCTPPSGSVFPVGTTTVICVATDSCGNKARCTFKVTVRPYVKKRLFPTPNLPPPTGAYVSPQQWHAAYANGIIISNASHRRFLNSAPPPPPGGTTVHNFGSQVVFDLLPAAGPPEHITANANAVVQVTGTGAGLGEQTFDTEMLALDIQGGNLPKGVMIRESPTRASTGETRMREAPGGYMISSFFDIFTELSLDGGQTWAPTETPAHVELQIDTGNAAASLQGIHLDKSGQPTFSLMTDSGLTYLMEYTDSLVDPAWFILSGALGDGLPGTQTDFQSSGAQQRFYRTRVEESQTE